MKHFFSTYLGPAIVALAIVFSLWEMGCAAYKAKGQQPAANAAVNSFEDYTFRVLLDAQAGLNKTRDEIQAGTLPPSLVPTFDRAVVVYNHAIDLEKTYDAALRSGADTEAQKKELADALGNLMGLIAELRPAKNATPVKKQ